MKDGHAQPRSPHVTLLSAPVRLGDKWGGSAPSDALAHARGAVGPAPAKLRVDDQTSGPPQDLPFEHVVKAVQAPRSLAHAPVFQVMFAWQNAPQSDFELPGLRVSPIIPPHVTAMFDLSLSLKEEGEEIVGGLEYAAALFDRKTIERHLSHWRNLLEAMAAPATAEITIGRLPMISAEERAALVRRGKGERAALPQISD